MLMNIYENLITITFYFDNKLSVSYDVPFFKFKDTFNKLIYTLLVLNKSMYY